MKGLIVFLLSFLLFGTPADGAAAEGTAPVAESMEFSTARDCLLEGQLAAADAEGGELSFILTTSPVKGSLDLREDGSFVYTPESGRRGRDYFGYKVRDAEGNLSQEATVIIRMEKP